MGTCKLIYEQLNKCVFFVCLGLSVCLIVASFVIPPKGVIDPSVLGAIGELFAFATLATIMQAIANGKKVSLSKGDVNMTVEKDDETID